jgi:hypothetical protein
MFRGNHWHMYALQRASELPGEQQPVTSRQLTLRTLLWTAG